MATKTLIHMDLSDGSHVKKSIEYAINFSFFIYVSNKEKKWLYFEEIILNREYTY